MDSDGVGDFLGAGGRLIGAGSWRSEYGALVAAVEATVSRRFEATFLVPVTLLIIVTAGDGLSIGEVDQIVHTVREASTLPAEDIFWALQYSPGRDEIHVAVWAKAK